MQKLDPVTLEATDQEVTMMDMYSEFNSTVAGELGLKEFKSRKVTKNYCFNLPDIPAQSDYLEVKYSVSVEIIINKMLLELLAPYFGSVYMRRLTCVQR